VEEWCVKTAIGARLNAVAKPEPITSIGPLFSGGSAA
jgi:hypothetical protein